MECNVGGIDRGLRGAVALAALGTALNAKIDSRWRMAAGIVGSIASFTFLSRYCPLNQMIGLNTCQEQNTVQNQGRNEDENLEENQTATERAPASWKVPTLGYSVNRY